jgi:hypothetical protein
MISDHKRAANRRNGRNSRGPRTQTGKARSSQNALRHGLSTIHRANPVFSKEIDRLARALCGSADDSELLDYALVIAECDMVLRCARAEEVAAIERLRDVTAVPLGKRNASLAQAKARIADLDLVSEEHSQYPGVFFATEISKSGPPRPPPVELWKPREPRQELDAIWLALPELRRLQRYQRRAWSRKRRAIRAFMAVKSRRPDSRKLLQSCKS